MLRELFCPCIKMKLLVVFTKCDGLLYIAHVFIALEFMDTEACWEITKFQINLCPNEVERWYLIACAGPDRIYALVYTTVHRQNVPTVHRQNVPFCAEKMLIHLFIQGIQVQAFVALLTWVQLFHLLK